MSESGYLFEVKSYFSSSLDVAAEAQASVSSNSLAHLGFCPEPSGFELGSNFYTFYFVTIQVYFCLVLI